VLRDLYSPSPHFPPRPSQPNDTTACTPLRNRATELTSRPPFPATVTKLSVRVTYRALHPPHSSSVQLRCLAMETLPGTTTWRFKLHRGQAKAQTRKQGRTEPSARSDKASRQGWDENRKSSARDASEVLGPDVRNCLIRRLQHSGLQSRKALPMVCLRWWRQPSKVAQRSR